MNFWILILVSALINVSYGSAVLSRSLLPKSSKSITMKRMPVLMPAKRFMSSSESTHNPDRAILIRLAKIGSVFGACYYGFAFYYEYEKANLKLIEKKDRFLKCNVVPDTLVNSSKKMVAEHVISDCFDAIRGDDTDKFMEKCIYSEFDANFRDKDGVTALELAIKAGKPCYLQKLIDNGADIDGHGSRGRYYLKCAIENDQPEAIKVLVSNGVDANSLGINWRPLLSYAIESGNGRVIRALIEAGADIKARDSTAEP